MIQIFGFEIRKTGNNPSFVPANSTDGAIETNSSSGAAHYGYALDINRKPANEVDQINKYRQLAAVAEVDNAIEDIVTEAIVVEDTQNPISININAEENEIPEQVKEAIVDEFKNICTLLNINTEGHDLFRQWYIDGRYYGHIIVDEANLSNGIQEIRKIDPRKMKKVRELIKDRNVNNIDIVTGTKEYFVFNDSGISATTSMGVQLSPDVILYTTSGLLDENNNTVSYLNKAIKPANQLRYMEDAVLIYTLSRAPERRVFYIDVSDLPKQKAEQYVKEVMGRYKNKIVYDSSSGEIKDDRVHMSMLEDYWLPRRSSGKTTEITTLQGSQLMAQMDNVTYFLNKLYSSLNVPASRTRQDTGFSIGRSDQITRDEVKFSKFISRLRVKFSDIFYQALRVQLVLKGIITPEDWQFVKSKIQFDYLRDNNFAELKENEIMMGRLNMLQGVQPYIGQFWSMEYVKKNILRQSTQEIEQEQERIAGEQELIAMQKQGDDNGEEANDRKQNEKPSGNGGGNKGKKAT